jgi:hypothetical protein
MRRLLAISVAAAVVAALCAGQTTASAAPKDPDPLDAYAAVVQAAELATIARQGIDVSGQRRVAGGIELDVVLDQAQAERLRATPPRAARSSRSS